MVKLLPATRFAKVGLAAIGAAAALMSSSLISAQDGDADMATKGRQIFADWSCGACHQLKDAGGMGHVGPTLDNPSLTKDYVVSRIANGQGAMPGFAGQLTDEEIELLSEYIVAEK